jgi:hypothetical protein
LCSFFRENVFISQIFIYSTASKSSGVVPKF